MAPLQRGLALDNLAEHLYDYLPGSRPPHADQRLSFPGVAAELGLSQYWQGGSKQPAIRHFLEGVLDSGTGRFSALIAKIVERSITYRKRGEAPLSRESIGRLNELTLKVGFRIPELHDPTFLDSLPRQGRGGAPTAPHEADPKVIAALQESLMALSAIRAQERGFAFEAFLSNLFDAHGLAPRGSFRLTGEQIDGSFQLGQEVYLLEAKWQDGRTGQADLLAFAGKVDGKAVGSLGLFVSYCGFSPDGLAAFARGKRTSIVCMDGLDLAHILAGRLVFPEVIARKRRRSLETNSAFVPVRDLFPSVI